MPFVRHLNHITQQSKFHGPGKATAVQQVAQTEVGTHDTFQQDKRELKVELSFCSDDETLDTKGSSVPKRPLQKKARRSEPKDPGTIRNGPCTKFIPVGLVFLLVWSYFFWVYHSRPAILTFATKRIHHNKGHPKKNPGGQVYHDLTTGLPEVLFQEWSVPPRVSY